MHCYHHHLDHPKSNLEGAEEGRRKEDEGKGEHEGKEEEEDKGEEEDKDKESV